MRDLFVIGHDTLPPFHLNQLGHRTGRCGRLSHSAAIFAISSLLGLAEHFERDGHLSKGESIDCGV